MKARYRETFGATDRQPGARLAISPRVAGARVEEHRHHDEIDPRARALVGGNARELRVQLSDAIDACRAEVIDPAVDGNRERRVLGARHRDDLVDHRGQRTELDREMRELSAQTRIEDILAAGADGERRAEVRDRGLDFARRHQGRRLPDVPRERHGHLIVIGTMAANRQGSHGASSSPRARQ